ncbi:hypothetical protein [Candidatus Leptofilum sp.]|uniref:hypothetical protein n=1 Tax=Candidatus Leptofilum sp. TaxID=3241576 RepID=UPI003B5A68F7
MNQKKLRQLLTKHFSREDLKNLCFDLEIDSDNFPNEKDNFIRELILYCKRNNLYDQLVNECEQKIRNKGKIIKQSNQNDGSTKTKPEVPSTPQSSSEDEPNIGPCFRCKGTRTFLGSECPVCKGLGFLMYPRKSLNIETCLKCLGTGDFQGKICPRCNGIGSGDKTTFLSNTIKNAPPPKTCSQCNGTGKLFRGICFNCRGTGNEPLVKV